MRIGIAEADIRTPIGMQMTGYAGRATGAIGVHDQLKMSALYFESKGTKSMIIVCQVLGFDPDYSMVTEAKISQALNIPVCNLILGSIHTHAGPASGTLYGCGCADPKWLEETQKDLIELAKKAVKNTFEGYFEYFTGESEIAMNRVAMAKKNPDYENMIDKEVCILKIYEEGTDRLKAIYANHGCHPVTLDNKNHQYSADYVHYMIKKLNETYGDDVAVIFSTGCCGDINPRYRFSFEMAEKTGYMLADSVIESKSEFKNRDIDIKCHSSQLTVPLVPEFTYEGFKKLKEEGLAECLKYIEEDYAPKFANIQVAGVKVLWADLCMKGYESGDLKTVIHPVIKVMKLGELTIVALPFEVFHKLGLRIKDLFGNGKTIVMGYSNGVFGYLPYGDLYEASYETKTAHHYYGYVGPVCKETGDIICDYLSEIK